MSRQRYSRKVNVHSNNIWHVESAPIININDHKQGLSGFVFDGLKMEVRFPLPYGKVDIYNFTKYIERFELTKVLAIAFYGWGTDKVQETRKRRFYFLDRFYMFLNDLKIEMNQNITSTLDIDKSLLSAYVAWLNKPKIITRGDKNGEERVWGVKSRRMHLTALTNLLGWLRREHSEFINENYKIPTTPWRDTDKKNEPTHTLYYLEMAAIETACLNKVKEVSDNFKEGRLLILSVMANFNGSINDLLNYDDFKKHETIRLFNEYVDALQRLVKGTPTVTQLLNRQRKGLLKITAHSVSMEAGLSKTGLNSSAAYDDILQAIKSKKYNISKKTGCKDIGIGEILTYIQLKYGGVIPTKEKDKRLNRAMVYVLRKHGLQSGELEFFGKYITISPGDLIPFIVIFTSRGFWNAEAILKAPRTGMWKDHPLRPDRVVMRLYKGRSGKHNTRTFAKGGRVPIDLYLDQVAEMTESLVKSAPEEYKERLFLFRTKLGEVTTFTHTSTGSACGDTWYRSLNIFIKENNLAKFTLRNLRITGGDRAHKVTGGDLKASQTVLNHKNIKITSSHYVTDAMYLRNSRKIADLQQEYLQWGKNSSQKTPYAEYESVNPGETNNAVTEGFTCKNPFQSPFNDKGTLCNAWLGCLHCENAVIIKNANTLARLLQLKEQFMVAKNRINLDRFIALYQTKLSIIEKSILPEFKDSEIWQEANKILLTLPDLPDIE